MAAVRVDPARHQRYRRNFPRLGSNIHDCEYRQTRLLVPGSKFVHHLDERWDSLRCGRIERDNPVRVIEYRGHAEAENVRSNRLDRAMHFLGLRTKMRRGEDATGPVGVPFVALRGAGHAARVAKNVVQCLPYLLQVNHDRTEGARSLKKGGAKGMCAG